METIAHNGISKGYVENNERRFRNVWHRILKKEETGYLFSTVFPVDDLSVHTDPVDLQ